RVLRAAERAGVARVVMTSSSRAAHLVSDSGIVIDERCWSDPRSRSLDAYSRAKILAERSAWEFMQGVRSGMTLATVLPSLVQGPLFGPLRSPSLAVTALLLQGGLRRIPPLGFNIVDVRDLADLHLRALFDPAAAGQRFVGTGGFLWMREIAALLRGRFPQQADAVPTRMAPAAMMGVEMLVNAELRRLLPRLRVRRDYTAAKAERLL
ncbi:NAD-dependent epimerase/dehydratase family protein, partial [Xanthomonas sp. Kuri4-1]